MSVVARGLLALALALVAAGCARPVGWWERGAQSCPPGTSVQGAPPPAGRQVWCARADGVRHGSWTRWFDDGTRMGEGTYRDGKPEGRWRFWSSTGHPSVEAHYRDGVQHGRWTQWYEDGQLYVEGDMVDGWMHGVWTEYAEDGSVLHRDTFDRGVKVD